MHGLSKKLERVSHSPTFNGLQYFAIELGYDSKNLYKDEDDENEINAFNEI